MENIKQVSVFTPSMVTFEINPYNESLQKAVSLNLLNILNLTKDESGYLGTTAFVDRKTKKKMIISRFDADKVMVENSDGFRTVRELRPEFNKLDGFFLVGNPNDYIFDENVKKGEIFIKWHPNIIMAYLCNISLLDPNIKFGYEIMTKKGKDNDSHIPAKLTLTASAKAKPYDANEVIEYVESLG